MLNFIIAASSVGQPPAGKPREVNKSSRVKGLLITDQQTRCLTVSTHKETSLSNLFRRYSAGMLASCQALCNVQYIIFSYSAVTSLPQGRMFQFILSGPRLNVDLFMR